MSDTIEGSHYFRDIISQPGRSALNKAYPSSLFRDSEQEDDEDRELFYINKFARGI
jgi:hypothetical protein